jgi:hypothetical protein
MDNKETPCFFIYNIGFYSKRHGQCSSLALRFAPDVSYLCQCNKEGRPVEFVPPSVISVVFAFISTVNSQMCSSSGTRRSELYIQYQQNTPVTSGTKKRPIVLLTLLSHTHTQQFDEKEKIQVRNQGTKERSNGKDKLNQEQPKNKHQQRTPFLMSKVLRTLSMLRPKNKKCFLSPSRLPSPHAPIQQQPSSCRPYLPPPLMVCGNRGNIEVEKEARAEKKCVRGLCTCYMR